MTITAKFPGTCTVCGNGVEPGQRVRWDKAAKTVAHETCASGAAIDSRAPASTTFAPTREQEDALALFAGGDSLAIEAGAGTGKTSTLRLLAEAAQGRRGQYVAFNKAIVTEAGEKMPRNVAAHTAHALAFRAYGKDYSHRLNAPRMKSTELALRLGVEPITVEGLDGKPKVISATFLAGHVMATITRFCQSADTEPTTRHFPYIDGIDPMIDGRRTYATNNAVSTALLPTVRRAWADLTRTDGQLPYRHDHYLKAWQLSGPRIGADFILFDEAQDANPVMTAIVSAQDHAQLVWVGDSQQQIYSFTGAVNALSNVPADQRAFLTQSFRFGPAIAEVANRILDWLPEAELRLVGTPEIPSMVMPITSPNAILTRTNAEAVRTVLAEQTAGRTPALVGGGTEIVAFAKGARDLMERGQTDHSDLACFDSWSEVQQYVTEDAQGGELRLNVKLVDDFGVPTILEALDRVMDEKRADVTVSTAHKAKGREWSSVALAGDFPEDNIGDEEKRLLYVACTRAKLALDITAVTVLREGPANSTPEEETR